jgi:hypothetical protein
MGWKQVDYLSHGSLYLAQWAAKSVNFAQWKDFAKEGRIILANGSDYVSLRDGDEIARIAQMVLNLDYFIDSKKVVSYIRKYGFTRIEGLSTGDRKRASDSRKISIGKRVKRSFEKSSDMKGQEKEQTKTLSMNPSGVVTGQKRARPSIDGNDYSSAEEYCEGIELVSH